MSLKLDMAKVYGKIELTFIKNTLKSMGFPNNITNTIMKCVTTVFLYILINGNNSNWFEPTRDIGQGDHLSPFLFIFYDEVLSGLLTKNQKRGIIYGLYIAKNIIVICHTLNFVPFVILFIHRDIFIICIS